MGREDADYYLKVEDVVTICEGLYTGSTIKKYAKDGRFPYKHINGFMMLTEESVEFMIPLLAARKEILFKTSHNIYCITNKVNGKRYIGLTKTSIEERFYEHKRSMNNCTSSDTRVIIKAFRKYGFESFELSLLDTAEGLIEAGEKESRYIKELGTHAHNGSGYNLTYGGEGVSNCVTPDWLRKFRSENNSGEKNHWYGKRGVECPHLGKTHTSEMKEDLSKNNHNNMAVVLNGVSYRSKSFAAKELGISKTGVDVLLDYKKGSTIQGIKPIVIEGVLYYSIARAAKFFGISDYKIGRKVLDGSAYWLDRPLTFYETVEYLKSLLGNKQQKVVYEGVEYPSLKRCEAATGLDRDTIKRLAKLGELEIVKEYSQVQTFVGGSRAISIDGTIYESMNKVCEALLITRKTVSKMVKEGKAVFVET